MPTATLTSKGQVTLPRKVREFLNVGTGDRLEFVLESDQVVLRANQGSLGALKGALRDQVRRPVSLAQMDAAILEQHSRRRR